MRILILAGALLASPWMLGRASAAGPAPSRTPAVVAGGPELRFVRDGNLVRALDLATLRAQCGARTVSIDDPYYGRQKSYRACPLAEVLKLGFGAARAALGGEDVVFRATDGYAKPSPADRLAEEGGYVAFSDADVDNGGAPAWQPIDRKQVDPGPYYLVWSKPEQRDTHRYPWPYELAEIEVTTLATRYPHTVPAGAPAGSPAHNGYETFKSDCIACHSINGEGGKVGPDLNVPKSIVEYRPADQIIQYIRDPATFRYTSMPAHTYLSRGQLSELLVYFRTMSQQKHDPGRSP